MALTSLVKKFIPRTKMTAMIKSTGTNTEKKARKNSSKQISRKSSLPN